MSGKGFSGRLRAAMAKAEMSQTELAEKAGCSKAAVSQYLAGMNVPREERLEEIAAALGVESGVLTGEKEFPAEPAPEAVVRVGKIAIREAARCLGKSEQFIRIGLQRGLLPFGVAVPGERKQWSYHISPALFRDYVGAACFDAYFGGKGARK